MGGLSETICIVKILLNKTKKILEKRLIYFSLASFFALLYVGFFDNYRVTVFVELLVLFFSFLTCIFCRQIEEQMIIILPFVFLYVATMICPYANRSYHKMLFMSGFFLLCGIIILLFRLLIICRHNPFIKVREDRGILLFAFAYFCACMVSKLHAFPFFDSGAYFRGCGDIKLMSMIFDFTPHQVVRYLLAQHISLGYSLFVIAGQLLTPGKSEGIVVVNSILASVSIICVYKIILKKTGGGGKKKTECSLRGSMLWS